ncbi:MAG: hypothetical protein WC975_16465 [Phycisphaerae bacterium]
MLESKLAALAAKTFIIIMQKFFWQIKPQGADGLNEDIILKLKHESN